ncbi:uncharacterized protein BDV14DRAFT_49972 [Aspergillus stella-maris]|uniref:uncharacterized protein n=1 Tax=Aspergillus stella-maris TaxID=1810926 RepID=UPI003CCE2B3F
MHACRTYYSLFFSFLRPWTFAASQRLGNYRGTRLLIQILSPVVRLESPLLWASKAETSLLVGTLLILEPIVEPPILDRHSIPS